MDDTNMKGIDLMEEMCEYANRIIQREFGGSTLTDGLKRQELHNVVHARLCQSLQSRRRHMRPETEEDQTHREMIWQALKMHLDRMVQQVLTDSQGGDERKFMELTIEEARKSVGENDRSHPKVGAVVVKDGKVVSAHRGELGNGEHAEYTALERKLADEIVAGATIYTTLEPCTTRNHPKVPCARRLIERKLGRVVIGMLDPNPAICGKGERLLRDHGIVVDRFPHELIVQLEELNREFTRQFQRPA